MPGMLMIFLIIILFGNVFFLRNCINNFLNDDVSIYALLNLLLGGRL